MENFDEILTLNYYLTLMLITFIWQLCINTIVSNYFTSIVLNVIGKILII